MNVKKVVLLVTSDPEHKDAVEMLPNVDNKDIPVEWIISVAMLTEGWDVKNVFQIVPMEEKAFNSKLLIAQVLGRGLRIPPAYPKAEVKVFNHSKWSKNIKNLVNELLEQEEIFRNHVITEGDRSIYNFSLYNLFFFYLLVQYNQLLHFEHLYHNNNFYLCYMIFYLLLLL